MKNYEPHEWGTRETISSEKLNHMENGISDAGYSLEELMAAVNELAAIMQASVRKLDERLTIIENQ